MTRRVVRGTAAVATAVVLGLTATACGGDGDEGSLLGGDGSELGGGTGGSGGSGDKGGKGGKGKPEGLLVKQADLEPELGMTVGQVAVLNTSSWQASAEVEARDPKCQSLFDMLDIDHAAVKPTAAASVTLTGKPYTLESMVQAYAPGQTEQILASLKAAVPACRNTEYRNPGNPYAPAEFIDQMLPTVGDGQVGYIFQAGEKGSYVNVTVGVVKVGDNLVVTIGSAQGEDAPPIEFKLIRAQVEKLTGKD